MKSRKIYLMLALLAAALSTISPSGWSQSADRGKPAFSHGDFVHLTAMCWEMSGVEAVRGILSSRSGEQDIKNMYIEYMMSTANPCGDMTLLGGPPMAAKVIRHIRGLDIVKSSARIEFYECRDEAGKSIYSWVSVKFQYL